MYKTFEQLKSEGRSVIHKKNISIHSYENSSSVFNHMTIDKEEPIEYLQTIQQHKGVRTGLIVLTSKKVIVGFNKGLIGGEVNAFLYKQIAGVDFSKRLLYETMTINSTGDKALKFQCTKSEIIADLIRKKIDELDKKSNVQTIINDDFTVRLKRLQNLKLEGAITEEEFNKMKASILKELT